MGKSAITSASWYAVTTRTESAGVTPSEPAIAGNATLAIAASSTTRTRAASTHATAIVRRVPVRPTSSGETVFTPVPRSRRRRARRTG